MNLKVILDNPFLIHIKVKIRTQKLSCPEIPEENLKRLKDIHRLTKRGKSNKEISEYMNNKYKRTLVSKKPYDQKLIWVTHKKYVERLKRLSTHHITYEDVSVSKVW